LRLLADNIPYSIFLVQLLKFELHFSITPLDGPQLFALLEHFAIELFSVRPVDDDLRPFHQLLSLFCLFVELV
jgi:hypothetical protein